MNAAVAPMLESTILDEMNRGPQQGVKSSFTVKDILQLPSTPQAYSSSELSGSSGSPRLSVNSFSNMYSGSEDRVRMSSSSSVYSEYGQDYGQYAGLYYPHQFSEPSRSATQEQRPLYLDEEPQARYQTDLNRNNFLSSVDQSRYPDIGTTEPVRPADKRVHSVESIAETSSSPSPNSTLPPSPGITGANQASYFSCKFNKSQEKSSCEKSTAESSNSLHFMQNGSNGQSYSLQTNEENKVTYEDDVTDISTSYVKQATENNSHTGFDAPNVGRQSSGTRAFFVSYDITFCFSNNLRTAFYPSIKIIIIDLNCFKNCICCFKKNRFATKHFTCSKNYYSLKYIFKI